MCVCVRACVYVDLCMFVCFMCGYLFQANIQSTLDPLGVGSSGTGQSLLLSQMVIYLVLMDTVTQHE